MTWRGRRRGVFEGPPRALYRRAGARYLDFYVAGIVINGVVVAGFGVVVTALYVDVSAGELALFAICSAVGYVVENLVAGVYLRRVGAPVRAWLGGERGDQASLRAWSAAALLPLALVRRPSLYAIGAIGCAVACLVLATLLELPADQAALLFPVSYLMYVSSAVLRYIALELGMRPVLGDIGERLREPSPPERRARLPAPPSAGDGADGDLGRRRRRGRTDHPGDARARDDRRGRRGRVRRERGHLDVARPRARGCRLGADHRPTRRDSQGRCRRSQRACARGLHGRDGRARRIVQRDGRRTRRAPAAARGLRRLRRSGAHRARPRRGHRPEGRGVRCLDPVSRRARVHHVRRERRRARGRRGPEPALRGGRPGDPPARRACQQVHR